MRRGVFSVDAQRDLSFAWDYIAEADIRAANRFVDKVEKAVVLLCQMPAIGHSRPDASNTQYRFWVVRPYVIAYRFNTRTLTVVRVIHGSRDFRQIFH